MIFIRYFLRVSLIALFCTSAAVVYSEDGYRLWMRYDKITTVAVAKKYQSLATSVLLEKESATLLIAQKELQLALQGFLQTTIPVSKTIQTGAIVLGTPSSSSIISSLGISEKLKALGKEGFVIFSVVIKNKPCTVIAANHDIGVLYGTFHFIRLLQTQQSIEKLSVVSVPAIGHRLLNHWDNLDRTVERGYAGFSLWDWHKLPVYIDPRYIAYARANASIGINGTVLTNVNANAQVLTEPYLKKVAALANVFRPYGIKVYLTARFSAPVEIGGLTTADPLDSAVQAWWKKKVDEIYTYIPDFGGFLVKANSEGQPGPQNYNRNHADGANVLAKALASHNGIVMWRAFVYSNEVPEDRAKQAYNEFKPLDGTFEKNVLVQVKNGPIDFQPREPFHPLFGAMPKTPLMMEFQLTQEYLGFATHLVYLAPLFKECLDADTYAKGKGSTVSHVIDGSLENHTLTGIAGVANIGNDRNWTGHPFAQANWYALGRLAWNPSLSSETIAEEWIRATFSNNENVVSTLKNVMLASREVTVRYMTPLGLHHIMGWNHHYGPGPWIKDKPRADWTSVYYHQADSLGIGFNRTATGSKALLQYTPEVQKIYSTPGNCPEEYLLWFNHVGWGHRMKSGRTLWDELCHHYYAGVDSVQWMQQQWDSIHKHIDAERYQQVKTLLGIQYNEAIWWRNACVLYFQTFSKRDIPAGLTKPDQSLDYYQSLEFPFAPGIKPKW
jgi:alpha-glucuronidase